MQLSDLMRTPQCHSHHPILSHCRDPLAKEVVLFLSSNSGTATVAQISQHVRTAAPHLLPGRHWGGSADGCAGTSLLGSSHSNLVFDDGSTGGHARPHSASRTLVAGSRRAREEWNSREVIMQYPAWFELDGPVASMTNQDSQPFPHLEVSGGVRGCGEPMEGAPEPS